MRERDYEQEDRGEQRPKDRALYRSADRAFLIPEQRSGRHPEHCPGNVVDVAVKALMAKRQCVAQGDLANVARQKLWFWHLTPINEDGQHPTASSTATP